MSDIDMYTIYKVFPHHPVKDWLKFYEYMYKGKIGFELWSKKVGSEKSVGLNKVLEVRDSSVAERLV